MFLPIYYFNTCLINTTWSHVYYSILNSKSQIEEILLSNNDSWCCINECHHAQHHLKVLFYVMFYLCCSFAVFCFFFGLSLLIWPLYVRHMYSSVQRACFDILRPRNGTLLILYICHVRIYSVKFKYKNLLTILTGTWVEDAILISPSTKHYYTEWFYLRWQG